MKNLFRSTIIMFCVILLAACGPDDMLWPSDKIGPMWVNRYGHSNSQLIWEYCDPTMTDTPGTKRTDCTVPWVDELFIDGYAVDLPAFNIVDFDDEVNGIQNEYRLWRIRLRNIPEGQHTLRYVMQVNKEVEDDPELQSPGTYELIVNFTFENK